MVQNHLRSRSRLAKLRRLDRAPAHIQKEAALVAVKYQEAVRAYRQLAISLQQQGLNDESGSLVRHALVLQRKVLLLQDKHREAWFSALLDFTAGYGYSIWRCFGIYGLIVLLFTLIFFLVQLSIGAASPGNHDLLRMLAQSSILSFTSFHGRAFVPGAIPTGLRIGVVAVAEGVMGLFIEAVLVATLIRRFFQ